MYMPIHHTKQKESNLDFQKIKNTLNSASNNCFMLKIVLYPNTLNRKAVPNAQFLFAITACTKKIKK